MAAALACVFIARWGSWPLFTPLLLKTLGLNSAIDFVLLSDVVPPFLLPANVQFRRITLNELTLRMQRTVGLQLTSLSAQARSGGWSSAKVGCAAVRIRELRGDLDLHGPGVVEEFAGLEAQLRQRPLRARPT